MRIISQDEKIDVPYEISRVYIEHTEDVLAEYFDNIPDKSQYVITIQLLGCQWENLGQFDSQAAALREMRRIRRAYEAGAKFYIIGTGDHDGSMEVKG